MKIIICWNGSWMHNCLVPWYTVVDEMSVDEMSWNHQARRHKDNHCLAGRLETIKVYGKTISCMVWSQVTSRRLWSLIGRCKPDKAMSAKSTNWQPQGWSWTAAAAAASITTSSATFDRRSNSDDLPINLKETSPLFELWQCQSQVWIKEEGDANHLLYGTVKLKLLRLSLLTATILMNMYAWPISLKRRLLNNLDFRKGIEY